MSFLDTTKVKEGNMTTDLYFKPTEKHQCLSPNSCHPKHCFKSIPFSQAIRVKLICSTVETTKQRLGNLRHHLKKRGYNDKVIESGFSKNIYIYTYTVRQKLSTTWFVSIISFLIMNLFQIDLLFPLPVHTYLLTCDLPGSLNFEKFEIKVEN